jgi:hypothetical protein
LIPGNLNIIDGLPHSVNAPNFRIDSKEDHFGVAIIDKINPNIANMRTDLIEQPDQAAAFRSLHAKERR